MNESTIEILGSIISVIILIFSGGLVGWLFGYRAGYHKAARDANISFPSTPFISRCTQCGGTMPDHYHGCPIAAEFKLVTIAKPGG